MEVSLITSLSSGESVNFGVGVVYSESTKTTTSLPIQNIILGSGHLAYCSKYMLNSSNPTQKKSAFFAQYCSHIYHSYILSGRFPLSLHMH